ncbi:MAG: SGNH/GDSL hydrolase family protein [Gammaproteobacteria bacterium]|nr:SGNH/GDSL hydrolase family protein [Gammaproteobacteria bacterium]
MIEVMTNRLTLIFVLLLPLCAWAQEEDRALVVVFGDSITSESGYDESSSGSFARNGALNAGLPSQLLTQILNESRRPSLVPNWGHGGTTTGRAPDGSGQNNGVERISGNLASSKATYPSTQKIVLILYGTNDFGFGIPASDTGFNTQIMIDRARAQGFIPVVGTLTPRASRSVASVNSAIKSAASIKNAKLVDIFTLFNAAGGMSLLIDGLHPTTAGYQVIAQSWFDEFLEQNIEAKSPVIAPIIFLLLDE